MKNEKNKDEVLFELLHSVQSEFVKPSTLATFVREFGKRHPTPKGLLKVGERSCGFYSIKAELNPNKYGVELGGAKKIGTIQVLDGSNIMYIETESAEQELIKSSRDIFSNIGADGIVSLIRGAM